MKSKMIFNTISFKIIFAFLIFVIPLISLLIMNNNYAIGVVRNQVAQSDKNLVSLYMGQIDTKLEEVDKYLYSVSALNTDVLDLELSRKEESQRYYKAKIRLANELIADVNYYRTIDMFFVYSKINDDLLPAYNDNVSYKEGVRNRNYLYQLLESEQLDSYKNDQWYIFESQEEAFLFHVINVNNVYIGAWVSAGNLMVPLSLIDLGDMGNAVLANKDGKPITDSEFVYENELDLHYSDDLYEVSGKEEDFLIIGEKSSRGEFSLIAIVPNSVILENLPQIQKVVSALIPVVSVLFVFLYIVFLRKILLVPINKIVKGMKKIKEGDLDIKIDQGRTSNEFSLMNNTFNSMTTQIHDLKIQVYEDQLSMQKAELRHMQLQIKPHFFMNSLNIIYQLAQVKDYKVIKEMSLCLIEYFRFMFGSSLSFVRLEEEVKHTENYFRIQKMRFHEYLEYSIQASEDLLDQLIPPLMIQTFVENAIKYAVNMDEPVQINVKVELEKTFDREVIKITIEDTGSGFPVGVLEKIIQNVSRKESEPSEHIGLWNARQRLDLLYEGKAGIEFANKADKGACVIIRIPKNTEFGESNE